MSKFRYTLPNRCRDCLTTFYDTLRASFARRPAHCRRVLVRDYRAAIVETLESRLFLSAGAVTVDLSAVSQSLAEAQAKSTTEYYYARKGNKQDVDLAHGLGGVALEGGGTDVPAAFEWMIDQMGGTGDFLVLRATSDSGYNSYISKLGGVNSVATLGILNRDAASDPAVRQIIEDADAIFIAGGAQDDYINFWQDTPVQSAIAQSILRGVPIGGTSAGADVIGQFIYSALNTGVTSSAALADPFNSDMTFARDFVSSPDSPNPSAVGYLNNTLVDTHFITRDRTGRMLAFLARVETNGWSPDNQPLGIGLNEQTALLIAPDGNAQVIGNAKAKSPPSVDFFMTPGTSPIYEANGSLTFSPIEVTRVVPGGTFDLSDWDASSQVHNAFTTHFTLSVTSGVLTTTTPTGLLASSNLSPTSAPASFASAATRSTTLTVASADATTASLIAHDDAYLFRAIAELAPRKKGDSLDWADASV